MNLSLKFLEHADKVFEIYPFNTLAEQNRHTLETIFGKTEAINDIAVVNSLTPIRGRGNVEEDPEKYYKEALLDRQFLNYPFILSSHVHELCMHPQYRNGMNMLPEQSETPAAA